MACQSVAKEILPESYIEENIVAKIANPIEENLKQNSSTNNLTYTTKHLHDKHLAAMYGN